MVLCSLDLKSTPLAPVGTNIQPRFAEGLLTQAPRLAVTSTECAPVGFPTAVPIEGPYSSGCAPGSPPKVVVRHTLKPVALHLVDV